MDKVWRIGSSEGSRCRYRPIVRSCNGAAMGVLRRSRCRSYPSQIDCRASAILSNALVHTLTALIQDGMLGVEVGCAGLARMNLQVVVKECFEVSDCGSSDDWRPQARMGCRRSRRRGNTRGFYEMYDCQMFPLT